MSKLPCNRAKRAAMYLPPVRSASSFSRPLAFASLLPVIRSVPALSCPQPTSVRLLLYPVTLLTLLTSLFARTPPPPAEPDNPFSPSSMLTGQHMPAPPFDCCPRSVLNRRLPAAPPVAYSTDTLLPLCLMHPQSDSPDRMRRAYTKRLLPACMAQPRALAHPALCMVSTCNNMLGHFIATYLSYLCS